MTNLVAFLGSPRKYGNSAQLVDAFVSGGEYSSRLISLSGMDLKGCLDCRSCWSKGTPCVRMDDMNEVYDAMLASDVLVFASPLYFYTFSSYIKPVFDRMIPFCGPEAKKNIVGKKAVLLATAGDGEDAFSGMLETWRHVTGYMKWQNMGHVCAHSVYKPGEISNGPWLEQAKALGAAVHSA